MGKLTVASNYSFDQWSFDFSNLYYGASYVRTSTTFRVNYSDGTSEIFEGTGFLYDAYGVPYSGTVTSYSAYYNGKPLVVFQGGSIAASDIVAAANTNWHLGDDEDVIFDALNGNDTLVGGNLADALAGFNGNDLVNGNGGTDILYGNDGNDAIIGGSGKDVIDGGDGRDTASYAGAARGVNANLTNNSGNTNDAYGDTYFSIESLIGSSYSDVLHGDTGVNSLVGGSGNDFISGHAGNDILYGGLGTDRIYGGVGADKFLFKTIAESSATSFDSIFDFMASERDRIDLSAIDASTKLSGNQAFSFIGTTAFSGAAGQLRYVKQASDTYIYADVNGDKKVDLTVHLDDAVTLTKDYFVL
ncbi:protease [Ensifer sp. IC3342]|nr:protease [Ensifer sp. BRP08]MCA1450095.1 protease [Ensifer sp. IC3342]